MGRHVTGMMAAAALGLAASAVHADDALLGIHVGASLGQANVRVDQAPGAIALGLRESHTAWKAFIGVRPISLLGAELAYVDLGNPSAVTGASPVVTTRARQHGTTLYAVGYLPLPLPLVDVFGKAGVVRMRTELDGSVSGIQCVTAGCNEFHARDDQTKFAWGAGVQVRMPVTGLSVRGEYERFQLSNGNPDLVSLGVVWHF